jgi:ribose transport system substrate-binding protein
MRVSKWAGTLALLALLASCKRDGKPVIGVVPKGANHIFWQSVHAGAVKAGQEFGYEIEWSAPALEIDSGRQIEIVDSMVTRRLAGIVLAPVDQKALVGPVERAAREGVPVAIFDSGIETKQRITYIATNNREGGRMAARRLAEILGGKGKVVVIGFMAGSASTLEREEGFLEEIKKHPGIEMPVGVQFGMANRAKAMSITENVLTAHPDIVGIFADNETSLAGAVQAVKGRNAKQVKVVGFDASDQLVEDLKGGWIDSLVVQNPFLMGYEATKAVALQRQGKPVAAEMDSGATLVKAGDLEKPEVKALLFPDLQRYLGGSK